MIWWYKKCNQLCLAEQVVYFFHPNRFVFLEWKILRHFCEFVTALFFLRLKIYKYDKNKEKKKYLVLYLIESDLVVMNPKAVYSSAERRAPGAERRAPSAEKNWASRLPRENLKKNSRGQTVLQTLSAIWLLSRL